MCEFMARWLSENDRWGSPVFIAGESYGGYRVGRLVRMLQEETGIGLNGAILISPALELTALAPSDYSVTAWVDLLPTMAGGAAFHGRSRAFPAGTPLDEVRAGAEEFASGDYATFLIRGASLGVPERERTLARLADFLGLPLELVTRAEGRVIAVRLRARAAPRRAEGRRLLRRHDHRHRSLPRPAGARARPIRPSPGSGPRTPRRSTGSSARRSASRPTASTACSASR